MGKIKHKRLKVSRYNPTLASTKGKGKESCGSQVNKTGTKDFTGEACSENFQAFKNGTQSNGITSPLKGLKIAYEKISSSVTEEKVTGLNMLAAFALELKAAESIVGSRMVSDIAPLLRDKCSQVRLAASGTLRNLCSWGSDEIVDMMVQQDVMEPLSQLLKSYEMNSPLPERGRQSSLAYNKGVAISAEEPDSHNLIFVHAVNVLWSLCECSEEALQVFNCENLVSILVKHIDPFTWNYAVSLAAADCLLCVSEDNSKTSSSILPLGETLQSLAFKAVDDSHSALGLHYAIAITGVLLNVGYWVPGDIIFCRIFEILRKVLETDASQSKYLENSTRDTGQESLDHIVSAQLIALEIFSNICCPDEEESNLQCEENYEDRSMSLEDEMMDLDTDAQQVIADNIPVEILEGIRFHQLIPRILEKLGEPSLDGVRSSEDEQKNIREKLTQVQIRSLQCFQNIINYVPVEDLGGAQKLFAIWQHFGQVMFSNSQQTDAGLMEALSGAMRATIDKLSEQQSELLSQISSEDLQPVFKTAVSCEVPSVKANLCRMIGTQGCALVKRAPEEQLMNEEASGLLTSITNALLKVSQEDASIWVRAEALDVLVDLFSDDKTDRIASHISLVENLKAIQPQFKAKFNQQKKTLGEHKPLVLTVRDNLVAFIKYKASRTCKYSKQ